MCKYSHWLRLRALLVEQHQVGLYNISSVLCHQERCYPLGEQLPAGEGEDPAEPGRLLAPHRFVLLYDERQVQRVRGVTLFLTTWVQTHQLINQLINQSIIYLINQLIN